METKIINYLTENFESFAHKSEEGVEFWLARDLQKLLGYSEWRNFQNVIEKAKTACDLSEQSVDHHFVDVNKMVDIGSGAQTPVDDMMLTRYACYLIAQNGDSKKAEIAFAQSYFAVQTRKAELIEQNLLERERVQARHKLAETEKELSKVIFEQTKSEKNFALIRSRGDQALFNHTTQAMKKKWGLKDNKPLADYMPTILLKAKDFATEITIFNAKTKNMKTESAVSVEHMTNNKSVRKTLISRGIVPENLSPEEDVKKLERKLKTDEKKSLKGDRSLSV